MRLQHPYLQTCFVRFSKVSINICESMLSYRMAKKLWNLFHQIISINKITNKYKVGNSQTQPNVCRCNITPIP